MATTSCKADGVTDWFMERKRHGVLHIEKAVARLTWVMVQGFQQNHLKAPSSCLLPGDGLRWNHRAYNVSAWTKGAKSLQFAISLKHSYFPSACTEDKEDIRDDRWKPWMDIRGRCCIRSLNKSRECWFFQKSPFQFSSISKVSKERGLEIQS